MIERKGIVASAQWRGQRQLIQTEIQEIPLKKKNKKLWGLSQTGRSYPDLFLGHIGHIQNSTGHSPEHTFLSRPCFEQEGGGLGSSEVPSNLKYSDSMVL